MPPLSPEKGNPFSDEVAETLLDEVWARSHARLERRLTKLESIVSALFDRSLEPTEILEAIALADEVAVKLSVLGFSGAGELIRRLGTLLVDPDLGLPHAISMASIFDDTRTAVATTLGEIRLVKPTGFRLKVVGAVSETVDQLIWLGAAQGLRVEHDIDGLQADPEPTTGSGSDDDGVGGTEPVDVEPVGAVAVVIDDPDLGRSRAVIRGIRETHPRPPIVLIAPTRAVSHRARVVEWVDTILDRQTPPLEVITELRAAVMRSTLPRSVSVLGVGSDWLAEHLNDRGLDVAIEESVDELFDALRSKRSRAAVLTPDLGPHRPIEILRMIRSDRELRSTVVIMIEPREDAGRLHLLRREGVDDIVANTVDLDDLAVLLKSRLARRALQEPLEHHEGTLGAVAWNTAVVLMERMITVSFRRHTPVGIAVLEFDVDEDEISSGELDQTMASEFRREDIFARYDERHVVVALQGVDRNTIIRRMQDIHQKFSLSERRGRAACVQFPVDGRSLDELLENAADTLEHANRNGAPVVLGHDWEPPSARAADVVLVDPDLTLGSVLVSTLERRGLSIQQQPDALDALAELTGASTKSLPSVVLLELDLIGIDGLQFLRQLRSAGVLERVKVIVLSARSGESDLRLAFELGADDYVPKPFSTPLLLHRLNRALGTGAT